MRNLSEERKVEELENEKEGTQKMQKWSYSYMKPSYMSRASI